MTVPLPLVMLPAGLLTDRFGSRSVMRVAYAGYATCVALTGALLLGDALPVVAVLGLAFALGCFDALNVVASPRIRRPVRAARSDAGSDRALDAERGAGTHRRWAVGRARRRHVRTICRAHSGGGCSRRRPRHRHHAAASDRRGVGGPFAPGRRHRRDRVGPTHSHRAAGDLPRRDDGASCVRVHRAAVDHHPRAGRRRGRGTRPADRGRRDRGHRGVLRDRRHRAARRPGPHGHHRDRPRRRPARRARLVANPRGDGACRGPPLGVQRDLQRDDEPAASSHRRPRRCVAAPSPSTGSCSTRCSRSGLSSPASSATGLVWPLSSWA